jgi:glycosyltransferase involved in cell wall biosynthesis
VPIVATASGGVVEILTDNEDALLVKPADYDSLAEAIEKLYGDTNLQKKLVTSAEKTFNDKFTLEKMIEKTTALYTEVLSGTKEN